MYGFKIVRRIDDKLYSCKASRWYGDTLKYCSIEYKLNEWVIPRLKNTGLYLFSSYKNAFDFYQSNKEYGEEIYLCKYLESKFPPKIGRYVYDIENMIESIVNDQKLDYFDEKEPPIGTISASKIMLLNKLSME